MKDFLERRERLLAQAAGDRERVVAGLDRYAPAAAVGDEVIRFGRNVAAHPEWVVAVLVVVAVVRPRLLLRLGSRAWVAWRTVRTLRSFLQGARG